jgi:hypothetical protein
MLWQTKEVVGTPKDEADLMLFIDDIQIVSTLRQILNLQTPKKTQ